MNKVLLSKSILWLYWIFSIGVVAYVLALEFGLEAALVGNMLIIILVTSAGTYLNSRGKV
jgi:hypothetical protein